MEGYITESQQLAEIKKFWDQYGNKIAAICLIAAAALLGWRYYQQYKTEQAEKAAMIYSTLLEAVNTGDNAGIQQASNTLARQYSNTPYAGWATLLTAKEAIEHGKLADAIATLQTLVERQGKTFQADLARLRLARVYLAQKKADETIKVLNEVTEKTLIPLVQQIKGDALYQQHQLPAAAAAYDAALAALPPASINYQIVRMQRDELAGYPSQTVKVK